VYKRWESALLFGRCDFEKRKRMTKDGGNFIKRCCFSYDERGGGARCCFVGKGVLFFYLKKLPNI
jgi:hypothetical protein